MKILTPSKAVLGHAGIITVDVQAENGAPYRPSNGTEGCIFEARWCEMCKKSESCGIYVKAFCGKQPDEWQYWNNMPLCTAWKDKSAPRKPRKPKPKPTPLLDWMAQQAPQEVGTDWIEGLIPPAPAPPTSPELPNGALRIGDQVRCAVPSSQGHLPWGGMVGTVDRIERDRIWVQYAQWPPYPHRRSHLEWVEDG